MKKLTKNYEIEKPTEADLILLEKEVPDLVLTEFKEFIIDYQGVKVKELLFWDSRNEMWILNAFFTISEILPLFKEFQEKYNRRLFPFAFDGGGWHFCLSMDEADYGAIIVNRWTDHLPEEQFLKIADSFEEFINGLKREDEIAG